GKSNDQAYNNFQEDNLSYNGSHDDDYKNIQEDGIQEDSSSHTESHEEVRESPLGPCIFGINGIWTADWPTIPRNSNRESIKTGCTCFINMCWSLNASNPTITKMDLKHQGHIPSPDTIHFANVYRQLPQNHRHSRLVGQALMSDETTSSYIWVLKNLLAATNNLPPTTIYSDCDTGLGPAIEIILPTT
ncbi:8493_t:CDS:2, partial [Gigaspora rosea]